MLTVDVKSF